MTLVAAVGWTVQAPVPEQAPPQPRKTAPPPAVAVRVTVELNVNGALQDDAQPEMPAGADATVAPLVKELLAKLEAIKASVKKYEEQVGKFAARAR